MLRFSFLFVRMSCLLLLPAANLSAQDQTAGDPAAQFTQVHAEWKKLDSQVEEVITAFSSADEAERGKLRKTYEELVARSRDLMPRLRQTAVLSYQASPNTDQDVTDVLVGVLANDVRQDKYEDALKLADMLTKNNCSEQVVAAFAGIAAYCLDDFSAAKTYLTKAKAGEALTSAASQCLDDLATASSAWATERQIREQESKDDDLPQVKMETNKGTMIIALYENEAPEAVGNFVSLVEAGYYDGLTFHRVLPGFMAQGGCPDGSGRGGPGYNIRCECHQDNYRRHFRGSLSMAHAGRDTGGSQFFLTFKRTAHLDGRHTVFGRVIEGLDVLAKLQRRNPQQPGQPDPDQIVSAKVVRKRDHVYQPTKVE